MAATNDKKYISLTGLGQFLNKLKNNTTYDDDVVSNKILLGTTEIDSGLRFPGESDVTGNNTDALNTGLVLSNSVLKSRGREINWDNLTTTTNLNYITSPGVYTITGYNNSSAEKAASYANLPYDIKEYGKFQARLTVTKIISGRTTTHENLVQHIDYVDSNANYGSFVRKGGRSYTTSSAGGTVVAYTWSSWVDLNKDTVYTHPNSGATAGSYGQSSTATLSHGGAFKVPYVTVNAQGHITAASTKTMTLPSLPMSDGGSTAGIIKTSFAFGTSVTVAAPSPSVTDQFYAVGVKKDEAGSIFESGVHVPWTDTKVTSSTSALKRYLLGHSSTATTATANTNTKCYMQSGYLYSNNKKVDVDSLKMNTVTNENVDIKTPVKLSPNKCVFFTGAKNIIFEFDRYVSNEINTYMFCFKSDGTTYVGPSNSLDEATRNTQQTNFINLLKEVLWLDGELPPFLFRNTNNSGTVEPTNEYSTVPAGFYEVIFTKYGKSTNLAYDGDTNGRTAYTTATWAYYC